jgi:glycerophosphoryl diester phosphodiesterase
MEQKKRTLAVSEKELLNSILENTKPSKYIIVDVKVKDFEAEDGTKKQYARLIVSDLEEYEKLASVSLTSRAQLFEFPIQKFQQGADLTKLVGKVLEPSDDNNWAFQKQKVDVGFGRSEYRIVSLTYKVSMEELATI